MLKKFC